jgi:hypothetical protein
VSLHQQRTPWMPWRRDVDLLVTAGTSTRLDWMQCGFKDWSLLLSPNLNTNRIGEILDFL